MFDRFAIATARAVGTSWAFALACLSMIIWAVLGPFFDWSDTWQLIANTGTTIITFLMVFLVQATQNRDTAELKGMIKEIVEDLPDVDEVRARERAKEER